jgi:hypothetical protein
VYGEKRILTVSPASRCVKTTENALFRRIEGAFDGPFAKKPDTSTQNALSVFSRTLFSDFETGGNRPSMEHLRGRCHFRPGECRREPPCRHPHHFFLRFLAVHTEEEYYAAVPSSRRTPWRIQSGTTPTNSITKK